CTARWSASPYPTDTWHADFRACGPRHTGGGTSRRRETWPHFRVASRGRTGGETGRPGAAAKHRRGLDRQLAGNPLRQREPSDHGRGCAVARKPQPCGSPATTVAFLTRATLARQLSTTACRGLLSHLPCGHSAVPRAPLLAHGHTN